MFRKPPPGATILRNLDKVIGVCPCQNKGKTNELADWLEIKEVMVYELLVCYANDEHDEPPPTFINHYHPVLISIKYRQPLSIIASH